MLGEEGYTETLYPIYSFPISLKLFQNKGFLVFFLSTLDHIVPLLRSLQ